MSASEKRSEMDQTSRHLLEDKVALITGAGAGIGRAIAMRFAREGATVIATSRTKTHVDETVSLIRAESDAEVESHALDVRDREATERLVNAVAVEYGRLDVVVANAGIDLTHAPSIEETTDSEWDLLFDVNVGGMFRICRAAIPHLRAGSAIVTIGSINSLIAWPNEAPYTATKGAVLQLTRAMALDLAPKGIRANCLCPGVIDTPMTRNFLNGEDAAELEASYAAMAPLNRMGTAEEMAAGALFLASDESSFMTGAPLVVDGGVTAR